MPDTPAQPATRRPRRSPALTLAETERDEARADLAHAERELADLERRHGDVIGAAIRATARAELAEGLLARAVDAMSQWIDEYGGLNPTAGGVIADVANTYLGVDPDQRPPRIRGTAELAPPWSDDDEPTSPPPHPDHPDDDEPPAEP